MHYEKNQNLQARARFEGLSLRIKHQYPHGLLHEGEHQRVIADGR